MAEKSPVKEAASSESVPVSNSNQLKPSTQFSTKFTSPTAPNSEIPSTPTSRPPPVDADVIHVPSYSRWFSWEKIDSCESRFLPEFFDCRSSSKNPSLYMCYRNSIIKLFRENPSRKITFTDARKALVGDVGSIRRVFDFLDHWGLINYSAPSALLKPSKETASNNKSTGSPSLESPSSAAPPTPNPSSTSRRLCGGCKTLCTIACFVCDKYDSTLCARCYVKGNFSGGLSNADFRRVEIKDDSKANWSEKETLLLLEAITHYGDDWKKVAQHIGGGRIDKDCVAHFVKLPFGEEYLGHPFSNDDESGFETNKKMRLTPLADASNPIMAQAAFLSALAGVEIAEAAAKAAVTVLSEVDGTTASTGGNGSLERNTRREPEISSNGDTDQNALERAYADVNSLLDKEERDIERAITWITEVQEEWVICRIFHKTVEKKIGLAQGQRYVLAVSSSSTSFLPPLLETSPFLESQTLMQGHDSSLIHGHGNDLKSLLNINPVGVSQSHSHPQFFPSDVFQVQHSFSTTGATDNNSPSASMLFKSLRSHQDSIFKEQAATTIPKQCKTEANFFSHLNLPDDADTTLNWTDKIHTHPCQSHPLLFEMDYNVLGFSQGAVTGAARDTSVHDMSTSIAFSRASGESWPLDC